MQQLKIGMFSVSVFLLVLIVKATIAQADQQFSEAPEVATAFINLKGVIGYIRFETINDTAVSVETNFTGLPGSAHNWHIHRFPVDLTLNPDARCLNNYVGGHYDPLMTRSNPDYTTDCSNINMTACEVGDLTGKFGQLANGLSDNIDDTGLLELGGIRGIVGRSIVVHATNGANFVCGTIRSNIEQETNTKIVTLSATFIAPLAGVIYLRQAGYEHAVMFGKLFWVNQVNTTVNHNWHIHQDMPATTNYRTGECTVGPHYDPFNRPSPSDSQYFCTPEPSNITNCEVGDLTGKHDTVDISANPLPYQEQAFFYTDIFLNLTGTNAVINRSIAIHDGSPIIACAPLVLTEARIANSFINGEFSARQDSPYEETIISSTDGIPSNPIMLPDVLSTYDLCPLNRTPYNPLNITTTELTTPDQIAIGDINTKHANLLNRALFSITEFPLFGTNIITSRTLMSSSNDRRSCSAIPPPINQGSTIIAVASFNTTIEGTILFIQEQLSDGTLGQTNIIVDIHYAAAAMQSTSGHNWHIHTLPPNLNQVCQGNIGPHFNPFNVSLNSDNLISNYSIDCSPFSRLRCESGDLTGKHGPLTLDSPSPSMATYSYLDPNLNLYGPQEHTIIGRSVGIHQNIVNGPILYCAEVRLANITTVQLAMTEPSNYNRVDFVNNVARSSGISAQSILVKHVDVNGSPTSSVRNGATCVNMTLSVLEFSDSAGSVVQGSLCDLYRSDQCMTTADYYAIQCPSGARSTTAILSLFTILLLVAIVAQWSS